MKSYQILALIGGVLGILVVFGALIAIYFVGHMLESFGGVAEGKEQIIIQITISFILYIVVLVIPFVIRDTKVLGIALIVLGIATLISAGGFGVVGFVLLIPAGILSLKEKGIQKQTM
jgi:hypothetical protein